MTDTDTVLAARFDATRERISDADWSDVVGRATTRGNRKRAWLAAAVVVVVAAPTAIAFAGQLRHLFFGTAAPPIIKRAFVEQNQMSRLMRNWEKTHGQSSPAMPYVDPAKAHGVLAVKTADGLLLLWAAPADRDRQCWFVDFAADQLNHKRATGGGSCDPKTPPSKMSWGFGWSAGHPTLKVLSGRLYVDAAAVIVHFPNRRPSTVPVVDRYFLAAYARHTRLPTALVAVNAHGQTVATAHP
jgi:hypothetical protein